MDFGPLGVRPHSIWNQISIFVLGLKRARIAAISAATFMEWPAPPSGTVSSSETQTEEQIMKIAVLGIDLGKNVCSMVGLDESGAVILRRRCRRDTLIDFVSKLPHCIVAMEACCGAHHLARLFAARGQEVRLMSPEYVRPYVKAQKNDDRDAEGIAEAATRPTMRFVETKTEAQLDMQTLHRSRDRLVGERTALINQLRAILLERGMVVPQGKRKLEQYLIALMEEQEGQALSERMRMLAADMWAQWQELDRRIAVFESEFVSYAKENEDARRLTTIPGVGVITATALIAAIGKAEAFEHGRQGCSTLREELH
jgi:transposase